MKLVQTVVSSMSQLPHRHIVGSWSLGVLIFMLSGCTQLDPTRTGYLSDYSQLHKQDNRIPLFRPRVIESGGSGLEAFEEIDSFLIEPIGWKAGEVAPGSYEESCQRNLSAKLRIALIDELSTVRKVVEVPGPHTARVRAAVTQVAFARPFLNTALSIVAVPLFNGGGVVEAEVKAPDGRQIAVVVAALPGRATDVLGFFTWQGHAESAMRRSAVQLKAILTQPPCAKPQVLTLEKNRPLVRGVVDHATLKGRTDAVQSVTLRAVKIDTESIKRLQDAR